MSSSVAWRRVPYQNSLIRAINGGAERDGQEHGLGVPAAAIARDDGVEDGDLWSVLRSTDL